MISEALGRLMIGVSPYASLVCKQNGNLRGANALVCFQPKVQTTLIQRSEERVLTIVPLVIGL
jgi:hypothetical protein